MAGFTSILFPHGGPPRATDAAPDCVSDLHVDEIIKAVNAGHIEDQVDQYFYLPLHDIPTVRHRHEVFQDLERNQTRQPILKFVEGMRTMRRRRDQADELRHRLQRQGWVVYAVQTYCDALTLLRSELAAAEPASRGLQNLARYLAEFVESAAFGELARETAAVRHALQSVRYSVHIQGRRVVVERYQGQADYTEGAVAAFERFAAEVSKDYHARIENAADMNHVEAQILDCVAELYPDTFALLDGFCRRHTHFVEPTIAQFDHEIRFYLHYLAYIRQFRAAGLHFSYPEITTEPGFLSADDAFDLALAAKAIDTRIPLVCNAFRLSGVERIFVVTGPNQGGKTTFARSIGQCAYLASLGCPVPARRAKFTLPDRIYTHFERRETLSSLHGRLEEELVRIHDILCRATATSLIVMNESFSSTTLSDALWIATQVVERVIELRCTAVYVTFIDQLASLDRACVSMVGEVAPDDPSRRTFKFTRRPADGLAYAAALAEKYGLDHDALRQRIAR